MNNNLEQEMSGMEMFEESEIWINDFNEDAVRKFRRSVNRQAMNGPDYPITIYIDSYGGYGDSLMAMIDIMESVPNPFVTVAVGKACSCGAILLSAGDQRYCGRNTRVMIHRSSAGSYGNMRNLTSDIKEMERFDHIIMDMFAKNCGLKDKNELFAILKDRDLDDLWLSATEAKSFGLVDHVGMPKIMPIVQWGSGIMPPRETARAREQSKTSTKTDNNKKRRDDKPPKKRKSRHLKG